MFVMPLTSMCVMESCERVYLIITLITRYFPFFFVFSFQFFLQLLCTSLVLLIFSYSAQIMLENALLCRRNAHLKNRLFCSKFCPQNLSKPTYVVTRQNTRNFKAAVVLPLSETTHLFIAF